MDHRVAIIPGLFFAIVFRIPDVFAGVDQSSTEKPTCEKCIIKATQQTPKHLDTTEIFSKIGISEDSRPSNKEISLIVSRVLGRIEGTAESGWTFYPETSGETVIPITVVIKDEHEQLEVQHKTFYIELKPQLLTRPVCEKHPALCRYSAFAVFLFLGLLILFGRYWWVVEPKNAHLRAMKRSLEARVISDEKVCAERKKAIIGLLNGVVQQPPLTQETVGQDANNNYGEGLIPGKGMRPSMLIAFSGKQLGAWRQLHEAERLLFEAHPQPVAHAQAVVSLKRLAQLPDSPILLRQELQRAIQESRGQSVSNDLISLVREAKALVFEQEDYLVEGGATAQNKAVWLVFGAYACVGFLGAIFMNSAPLLLVAGAIGGLLARLRKAVSQSAGVFDYGTSWGVLFLTPLTGALTGWIGTAFVDVLQEWEFINETILNVDLFQPNVHTLLVSLVFGMSATIFDVFAERFQSTLYNQNEQELPNAPRRESRNGQNGDKNQEEQDDLALAEAEKGMKN